MTPVVVDGVMYVTSANECYALDAGSGREIWHYQRPRTKGLIGNAAGGVNRGVGVAGDRVFMVTDHAHLIALNRLTGALLWETEMADWHQNYNATGAPLPVGNLVVTGTSGGDEGVRGFVAAFDQATGKEVWRFWTVPAPGEPRLGDVAGQGDRTSGRHDVDDRHLRSAQLDTLYWPIGNPVPDLIGDDRLGDNLYTDSVVALDAKTGRLKWHFQFTPHDVWDYDAQETPALVDATWQGQPRKLLVQANRNGFFYVLDRTNGKFLFGTQYVKNVTWATGLDAEGPADQRAEHGADARRQARLPVARRRVELVLDVVQSGDRSLLRADQRQVRHLHAGRRSSGRPARASWADRSRQAPDEPAQRVLRAIDIQTGKIAWELPQTGAVNSWGGMLSTAGRRRDLRRRQRRADGRRRRRPASRCGAFRRTSSGRRRR